MSGHSKWHNIRLRKGKQDALRGNLFTKLAKEIIVAARNGGGNPDTNLRLRMAVDKARQNSMPLTISSATSSAVPAMQTVPRMKS